MKVLVCVLNDVSSCFECLNWRYIVVVNIRRSISVFSELLFSSLFLLSCNICLPCSVEPLSFISRQNITEVKNSEHSDIFYTFLRYCLHYSRYKIIWSSRISYSNEIRFSTNFRRSDAGPTRELSISRNNLLNERCELRNG